MFVTIRPARIGDLPILEALIPESARLLQAGYYSSEQIEGAIGTVFGVDRQLIMDGTYFVAEIAGQVVGCGGWSKRKSLYGSDRARKDPDPLLDPASESARIRAFFVRPGFARHGIGRQLMAECESAALQAGFRSIEIVATLAGEPLYASFGYAAGESFEIVLPNGSSIRVVRMAKSHGKPRRESAE